LSYAGGNKKPPVCRIALPFPFVSLTISITESGLLAKRSGYRSEGWFASGSPPMGPSRSHSLQGNVVEVNC